MEKALSAAAQAEGCTQLGGLHLTVWKMVRTLFSLAAPAQGCQSILREEALGPQDARGTGVKLCRADGPAATGGGWHPGPARPLPSCPRSLGTDSAPAPSLLPPAPRSLARSLAGSSSLARPRPAQLGQSDRGAERASSPGGSGGCPGPRPPPRGCRLLPFLARRLPPSPAPAPSARPAARGSERPAATMPAARPAAAGPGGIALLLALLLGSPAAAPAGGKRPERRGGGGGKVAASTGRLRGGGWGSSWLIRRTRPSSAGLRSRGRLPTFGAGHSVPLGRVAGSVEAGMCLKDSGALLPRPRVPCLPPWLRGSLPFAVPESLLGVGSPPIPHIPGALCKPHPRGRVPDNSHLFGERTRRGAADPPCN